MFYNVWKHKFPVEYPLCQIPAHDLRIHSVAVTQSLHTNTCVYNFVPKLPWDVILLYTLRFPFWTE